MRIIKLKKQKANRVFVAYKINYKAIERLEIKDGKRNTMQTLNK